MRETGCVVAGVDEVGRGAWAGPVVAGAVILDPEYRIKKARDSKLMKASDRLRLAVRIRRHAIASGVGVATLEEVNQYGLSWAIKQSGLRAIEALGQRPDRVLLDGHYNYFPNDLPCDTMIDGDAHELCIATASIIAKVHRDGLMAELDERFPGYHLASNKGYGTMAHRRAIEKLGVAEIHRTGWRPIAAAMQAAISVPLLEV